MKIGTKRILRGNGHGEVGTKRILRERDLIKSRKCDIVLFGNILVTLTFILLEIFDQARNKVVCFT